MVRANKEKRRKFFVSSQVKAREKKSGDCLLFTRESKYKARLIPSIEPRNWIRFLKVEEVVGARRVSYA